MFLPTALHRVSRLIVAGKFAQPLPLFLSVSLILILTSFGWQVVNEELSRLDGKRGDERGEGKRGFSLLSTPFPFNRQRSYSGGGRMRRRSERSIRREILSRLHSATEVEAQRCTRDSEAVKSLN